jgi:serine/threonine-protein kinase
MDLKRAGAALSEAGLAVGNVAERAGTGARPGLVIEQKKPAGSWAVRGSAVDLVAAAGADEPATLRMPDLAGMPLRDAYRALQKDGFAKPQVVAVAAEGAPADTVVGQDPAPGSPVARDTAVKLKVARTLRAVEAGGPLDADKARTRCPAVCAAADARWTGQWRATGQKATCQCAF